MSEVTCPICGNQKSLDGNTNSVVHCECNAVHAIATPHDATVARVATTPPIARGIAEGLPPMPGPTDAERPVPRWFPLGKAVIVGTSLLVLIGLGIPVIHKARESAARTQSTQNLREIGLATYSFHDAHRRLPFNGTKLAVAGDETSGSWAFMLLPFLNEKVMFDTIDRKRGLDVLLCPGRGRPQMCDDLGRFGAWSDYCINPFLNSNTGQANAPDKKLTLVGILDGSSNTIVFGHGRVRPDHYGMNTIANGFTDTIFNGGSQSTCRGNTNVTLARDSADAKPGEWGGPFPGHCLMVFCDATVRGIPYSMEIGRVREDGVAVHHTLAGYLTVAGALTPSGGEGPDTCAIEAWLEKSRK